MTKKSAPRVLRSYTQHSVVDPTTGKLVLGQEHGENTPEASRETTRKLADAINAETNRLVGRLGAKIDTACSKPDLASCAWDDSKCPWEPGELLLGHGNSVFRFTPENAERLIQIESVRLLKSLNLAGGHPVMTDGIEAWKRRISDPNDPRAMERLYSYLELAKLYRFFLDNKSEIEAVMAVAPRTMFTLNWVYTLTLVEMCGINNRRKPHSRPSRSAWMTEMAKGTYQQVKPTNRNQPTLRASRSWWIVDIVKDAAGYLKGSNRRRRKGVNRSDELENKTVMVGPVVAGASQSSTQPAVQTVQSVTPQAVQAAQSSTQQAVIRIGNTTRIIANTQIELTGETDVVVAPNLTRVVILGANNNIKIEGTSVVIIKGAGNTVTPSTGVPYVTTDANSIALVTARRVVLPQDQIVEQLISRAGAYLTGQLSAKAIETVGSSSTIVNWGLKEISSAGVKALGDQLKKVLVDSKASISDQVAKADGSTSESLLDVILSGSIAKWLDKGEDFAVGKLKNGVGSAIASFITTEAAQSLGLSGFSGQVFTSAGGTIAGQLRENIKGLTSIGDVTDASKLFNGFDTAKMVQSFGTSLGGLLGSQVSSEFLKSAGQQFFGSLAGTAASIANALTVGGNIASWMSRAGAAVASFTAPTMALTQMTVSAILSNVLLPGIGAFLTTVGASWVGKEVYKALSWITGGKIKSLFGGGSTWHYLVSGVDPATNRLAYASDSAKNTTAALREGTFNIANGINGTVNSVLDVLGARIDTTTPPDLAIAAWVGANKAWGANDNQLRVLNNTASIQANGDATRLVKLGATYDLSQLKLTGGDPVLMRAFNYWKSTISGVEDEAALARLEAALDVASDYKKYLANKPEIDAIIAIAPTSSISIGWINTLTQAQEMGLVAPAPKITLNVPSNRVFDGTSSSATATVVDSTGKSVIGTTTITYYQGIGTSGQASLIPPKAAGDWTVVARFDSSDPSFSSVTSAPVTFTIGKVAASVTAQAPGGKYTGAGYAATATATGLGGATVPGSFVFRYFSGNTATGTSTTTAPIAVGTYTVVGEFTSTDGNYTNATSVPVTFTIGKVAASVTAQAPGGKYTGAGYAATATATGLGGATVPGSFVFRYFSGNTATGTSTTAAPIAVGTYTVVGEFTSLNGNYGNATSAPVVFSITPVGDVWSGAGGDAKWNNPKNWADGTIPTVTDDVSINVPSTYVIDGSGPAIWCKSLVCTGSINVVDQFMTVKTTATVTGGINANGNWAYIDGGNFKSNFNVLNGTFNGVTLNGDMTLLGAGEFYSATINGNVTVTKPTSQNPYGADFKTYGTLTLNGTMYLGSAGGTMAGTIYAGGWGYVHTAIAGNANIIFGSSNGNSILNYGENGTLTFGPSVVIHGTRGRIDNTYGGMIINQGTISADVAGGQIKIGGFADSRLKNLGILTFANGGTLKIICPLI